MAYVAWSDYEIYMDGGDTGHVTEEEFAVLSERASEAIDAATMYKIDLLYGGVENLSAFQTKMLKRAVCAQIEYFGIVGSDEAYGASAGGGFSVGKVRVDGAQTAREPKTICKAARSALAMTGLLYAGVCVRE